MALLLMAYLVCPSQISWCDEVFAGIRIHRPRGSSEPSLTSALLLHSTRPWSSPLLRPRYSFFSVVTDSAVVLFVIQWTLCSCVCSGITTCPEQDFGTSNLHVEISDTMSILVYVGVAKGNGAPSKAGTCK